MEKTMSSWSDLDCDLLLEIAGRISCLRDFIVFGAVCRSWRSVASPEKFNKSTKVPWLLLDQVDGDRSPRKFFNLSKDVIYSISLPKPSENRFHLGNFMLRSNIKEKRYLLSSRGWYLMVEDILQLNLLNPFSLSRIDLPHCVGKFNLPHSNIIDFALSSSPSVTSEFIIMIVYFSRSAGLARLVFWKSGDREWTDIDLKLETINVKITYHNGRFYIPYVVYPPKGFVVHEINIRNYESVSISSKSFTDSYSSICDPFWIFESSRALMISYWRLNYESIYGFATIIRDLNSYNPHLHFVVQEIDFEKGEFRKVSDLGDEAIFLGCYSSFLVNVSNESRFKSNHIYFAKNFQNTWRHRNGGVGVGVYSMTDGSSEPLFSEVDTGYRCSSEWIEPRL
ncbi:putative F-box protein At3g25750 [Mercurialis annua]|uniref:putative F-box protein At3g25750 n=1 Tax=Mercurialis annua TaxID=3986 RepID=UPI00215E0C0C|nr:putative F-box protein At3g25750 [Mercurialis annua]